MYQLCECSLGWKLLVLPLKWLISDEQTNEEIRDEDQLDNVEGEDAVDEVFEERPNISPTEREFSILVIDKHFLSSLVYRCYDLGKINLSFDFDF